MNQKKQILTKSGIPISPRTFGILVCSDKVCRHAAVDLGLYDADLHFVAKYFHHCGYRTIEAAQKLLVSLAKNGGDPIGDVDPIN
jgi:hypothetical protein